MLPTLLHSPEIRRRKIGVDSLDHHSRENSEVVGIYPDSQIFSVAIRPAKNFGILPIYQPFPIHRTDPTASGISWYAKSGIRMKPAKQDRPEGSYHRDWLDLVSNI